MQNLSLENAAGRRLVEIQYLNTPQKHSYPSRPKNETARIRFGEVVLGSLGAVAPFLFIGLLQ